MLALDAMLAADAGWSLDLTPGVMARALTHTDNAYWIPHFRAVGYACKTHKQSNTAFRGFGGPQGVVVMEDALDRIASHLGRDPAEVRALNFYNDTGNETPYGQTVEDNHLPRIWAEVKRDADIARRRAEIDAFNQTSPVLKRGLGLFPLKFGISFNIPHMNQAGALVHVYTDGSIRLNHGGTEMGQGLFVKVAQVVAEVFKVDIDRIRPSATSTAEVPNTSPTAASTGSDLNGWAAYEAANTIKRRMMAFAAEHFGAAESEIAFADDTVRIAKPGSNQVVSFGELARLCLSRPRLALVDRLLQDAQDPLGRRGDEGAAVLLLFFRRSGGRGGDRHADRRNPRAARRSGAGLRAVAQSGDRSRPDRGRLRARTGMVHLRGAVVGPEGRLRTVGPSTYKIPGSRDAPAIFNVRMLDNAANKEATIFRSKAVGEPPLMLATAVWNALKDAIAATAERKTAVRLDAPATPERILTAIAKLKT